VLRAVSSSRIIDGDRLRSPRLQSVLAFIIVHRDTRLPGDSSSSPGLTVVSAQKGL